MASHSDSNGKPQMHWLDRIIGRADRLRPDESPKPSQSTLQAFILGEATEQQRDEIIAALSRSRGFRREIKEMTDDLEAITDEQVLADIASPDSTIVVPDFSKQIQETDDRPGLITRIRQLTTVRTRIVVPALAAAAALAIWFSPLLQRGPSLQLVAEAVDPALLSSESLRGDGEARNTGVFESDDSAALSGFASLEMYEGLALNFSPDMTIPPPPGSDHAFHITIVDEEGRHLKELTGEIPAAESAAVWILSLPSRSLWKIELKSDQLEIPWQTSAGTDLCVATTYSGTFGSRSGPVFTFELIPESLK